MIDLKRNFWIDDCVLINFVNMTNEEKAMIRRWRNNKKIRKWMYSCHIILPEEHNRFIEDLEKDGENFYWLLKNNENYPSGVIYLNRIDFKNKNAYIGIYSNPTSKLPCLGQRIMKCLKVLAFDIAGLHTLKLEVIDTNEHAVNFYKKSGFCREGRLEEFVLKNSSWCDVLVMGIVNKKKFADGNKNR